MNKYKFFLNVSRIEKKIIIWKCNQFFQLVFTIQKGRSMLPSYDQKHKFKLLMWLRGILTYGNRRHDQGIAVEQRRGFCGHITAEVLKKKLLFFG